MLSIRKIGAIGRTYRHLTRYRQILTVLFKYGFEDLIDLLKIEQYIEIGLQLISRKRRDRLEKFSRPQRVRMALEELGPTFIKLGQILSTRPDLIPIELLRELSRLQDKVPASSYEEIREILVMELGAAPEKRFASFEEIPFASASIGQVHRAELPDGESVAVKVQRPGIRKVIEVDLEIILHLATLMERHIEEISLYRPVKIVEEFARTLEREIDYRSEATGMERTAQHFLNDPRIYIPKVYREVSTASVLTMEFMDGIKVSEVNQLVAVGLDRHIITDRGADVLLKQIFEFGFFHADPHPGNIFVLPGNVICLIDFGMMGTVSLQVRENFVELIDAVVRKNESRATQMILKLTSRELEPDLRALEKDVAEFMGAHLYKPLKDIHLGKLLQQLLEIAALHQLIIPPDIFLMIKALAAVEGVALMLNPEFDMVSKATPFIEKIKLARYHPKRLADDVLEVGVEMSELLRQLPRDMLDISRMIKQQKLFLNMELKGLEATLASLGQISNRIAFAIIIAGLIIGSSIIVISEIPPLFYGISLIGIILFLTGAIMGMWLLIAILRSGRL
jgi:ubiquinone biosynthesis protein